MKTTVRIFWVVFLVSCAGRTDSLERSLILSGANRLELEKVLNHYSQNPTDSQKLRAAEFLIENMPSHYYNAEQPELYESLDSLNLTYDHTIRNDFVEYRQKYDSLVSNIAILDTIIYKDTETLSSEFLIQHIDSIFAVFEQSPWRNHLSFADFCKYLLPYSISDEKREPWIAPFRKQYERYFADAFRQYEECDTTLNSIFNQLRTSLDKNREIGRLYPDYQWLKHYPPTMLINVMWGSCENNAFHLAYILRSAGIPATIDYAPQWATYALGHLWNVIPDKSGKMLQCDRETDAGTWKIDPRIDLPKVYRYAYVTDREKEEAIAKAKNFVPEMFKGNFIDVTAKYVPVSDITLKAKAKLMYLCVFDNANWKPVAMAVKERGKAVFRDMGRKVVYLPTFYKGKYLYCSDYPFVLDSLGQVNFFKPDLQDTQTMLLTRKFHSRRVGFYYNRMLHGRFQGANRQDFNDATDLYEITEVPPLFFSTVELTEARDFRYFRYLGAKGSWTNIAELEVYGKDSRLNGIIIGTQSSQAEADKRKDKNAVFDNDGLTYFKAETDSGGWVGLDFGQKQTISKIRFLPRNDDNNIRNGDEYELFYMDKTGWKSLGRQTGTDAAILVCDNCPTNALFLLRNHTRGKEERIFTYENGKQVWW
jgi:hypothetical protein